MTKKLIDRHLVDTDTGEIMEPQGEEISEEHALHFLPPLYGHWEAAKDADRIYRRTRQPVESYMQTHGITDLYDPETNYGARYASGGEDHLLAWEGLLRDEPRESALEAILELVQRGLVRLDWTGFQRQETTMRYGSVIRRFVYPVGRSPRFIPYRKQARDE